MVYVKQPKTITEYVRYGKDDTDTFYDVQHYDEKEQIITFVHENSRVSLSRLTVQKIEAEFEYEDE